MSIMRFWAVRLAEVRNEHFVGSGSFVFINSEDLNKQPDSYFLQDPVRDFHHRLFVKEEKYA